MKILLHDGYNYRRGLSEPFSATAIAIINGAKQADKFVKEKFGSWAGLNATVLSWIGKDPRTDPKEIDKIRKDFLQSGGQDYNTELGTGMRAIFAGNLSDVGLLALSNNLQGQITRADKGAKAGDWAAARYLVVFGEFMQNVKSELDKRAQRSGRTFPGAGGSNTTTTTTTTGTDLKSLVLPAAVILGIKFLLF